MRLTLGISFLLITSMPLSTLADRYDDPAIRSALATKSYLSDAASISNLTVLVGERGHVLYKKKGGSHWEQARVPSRTNLNAISMNSKFGYWAVGHDTLVIKSDKDVAEWVVALPRDKLLKIGMNEIEKQRSANSIPDGMGEAIDFMYEELEAGLETGVGNSLFDVAISSNGQGIIVGSFGLAFLTSDGGASWEFIGSHLDNPDSLHLYASLITEKGEIFIAGESGLLFYSKDSIAWSKVKLPYQGTLLDIHTTDVRDEIYILGMGGKLLKSVNAGHDWTQIQLPSKTILQSACSSEDGYLYLVGVGGYIYRLKNNEVEKISFSGKQNLAAIACKNDQLLAVGQGGIHQVDSVENN